MKKLLVICLSLVLFVSMGCGNQAQEEKAETDETTSQASPPKEITKTDEKDIVHKDPVDGSIIRDVAKAKYSHVFEGRRFYFNSKQNLEAFKKDPRKYLLELPKLRSE